MGLWTGWNCHNFLATKSRNGKHRLVDYYENTDQPIQFYFPLFGKPMDSKFQYSDDDLKAIQAISQYPKAVHFGDPDVKKRSFVAQTSTRNELVKAGIYVQSQTKNDFQYRRDITKIHLGRGIEIHANHRTDYFFESVKQARYPQREETSQATTPVDKLSTISHPTLVPQWNITL